MSWFAAHAVLFYESKPGAVRRFRVWENILLTEASSIDEALLKARERALLDAEDGWQFAGIRKVTKCFSLESFDNESRPGDGSELTFTQYEVDSEADIRRLAGGGAVDLYATDVDDVDEVVSPEGHT